MPITAPRTWKPGAAALLAALPLAAGAQIPGHPDSAPDSNCTQRADAACWQRFALPGAAGQMHYLSSQAPAPSGVAAPTAALVVLHGHPRDAVRSFEAGLQAARLAGQLPHTLVVAPLYQVADAARCHSSGIPAAQPGDALWTCSSWLAGQPAAGDPAVTSFAALDALVAELHRQWPGLHSITLAGFSAGAQMLQHSVGFAAAPPDGIRLHYVIADPGSWLYFDAVRPQPLQQGQPVEWAACQDQGNCSFRFQQPVSTAACPGYNQWKYGVQRLPASLPHTAAQARAQYAQARIAYLEGGLDNSAAKGTYYPILDKSCSALLQGPFRLQRGLAYLAYDNTVLAPGQARQLTVVPGCAHDVACVLPSAAARAVLFPPP